jgi:hypothetical protein
MGQTKRFIAKHGLQTDNVNFVSDDKTKEILTRMLDSGTLSFSGTSGQLFSITDSMEGTIFAVNDISGVPSIEVDDDGTIRFAETFGNVLVGTATDTGEKLQVNGKTKIADVDNGVGDFLTRDANGVVTRRTAAEVLADIGGEGGFTKGNLIAGTNVTLSGTLTNRLVGTGDVTVNAAATNLAMGGSGNSRTITSSTGTNVSVPIVTITNAGFMSIDDKTKLDGIETGAQVNVATNLTYTAAASNGTVNSSTGTNATIPAATTSLAGLLTSTDKTKLDGIETGAQVNVGTNLSITAGTTAGPTINSSTGTNATLPTASGTASGVVTTGAQTWAGVKTFSSTITGSISGNAGTATTLQTARTINGTSFDGSANITTANWGTARTLTIGSTGKSVNGSGNVSWSLAEIGVNDSTLTLATSGIATGSQTWTSNQGSNATFTVNVPGTNLAMGGSGNSRTITSSTGDNVSVPVVTTTNAGFMATGDKTKLDGIEAGAQVNVGTNLGSSGTGGTRTITSSTGTNTSITYTAADLDAVPTSRTLTAGDGLSGGGNLTSNRSFAVDSTVVRTSGNQTIGGNKTFSDNLTVTGSSFAALSVNRSGTTNAVIGYQANDGGPYYAGFDVSSGVFGFVDSVVGINNSNIRLNVNGNIITNGTVTAPSFSGSLSGNATTATTLATARTINGTSFNGSSNITTANWGTARTLTIGSTGKSVNGSGNVSWSLTEIGAADRNLNLTAGDGLSGGGNLTANRSFAVDGTVVRTSGNQTITGDLTLIGDTNIKSSLTLLSPSDDSITIEMLDGGTMSFEGDSGQLFSITDSLTGTIFSVNDISGIPSIEVDDDGTIRFAEFAGNVLVGTATDTGEKLQVDGNVKITDVDNGVGDFLTRDANGVITRRTAAQVLSDIGGEGGFTKGNLVAGSNVTLSGTLTNRLVGTGDITVNAASTNLGITAGTTAGPIVTSSTGTNATLPTATASNSGVVTTGNQTWAGVKTFNSTITGSVSGNAGTATTLQTARTINGTSFNGSANITTANWGTARTLTIGSTGKSVNGSGNVSWTLAEIGAADRNLNLTAGDGLSGGGNLTANRSFAVDSTVVRTSGNQTIAGQKDFSGNGSTIFGDDPASIRISYPGNWATESSNDHDAIRIQTNGANDSNFPYGVVGIKFATSTATGWGPLIGATRTGGGNGDFVIKTGGQAPVERFRVADNGNITASNTITAPSFSGSLSGNATTATTLQTARTINGTSFNGSANITTANWGTARTLTIGSTGKSVNGSGNVSWSLAEIGVNNSTLTLATSGIATGSQTWTSNQGTNATFTVDVPATNLAMGGSGDSRTITSSTGTNVSVPVVTTTNAGFMATADKTKLDGIETGAQVNVATNLGITAGTTDGPIVTSSTGTNATLPTATATNSGVVTTGNQTWAGVKTFNSTITGSISGNAGTATTLQTARTINGTSFNGSANITILGNFANRTTNESGHAVFISTSATGNRAMFTNTNYRFNPSTAELSATNFNSTSDINKKKNVKTIENALEKVQSVRGVNFEWKDDGRSGTGVIAQEIEAIIPEVVVTDANGNKTVQYGNLIGLLIEAIKDQQKQIIELKHRIDNDK